MYVCASGVGLVSDSLIALGGLKYLVTLYTEVNTVVKSIITYLYRNVSRFNLCLFQLGRVKFHYTAVLVGLIVYSHHTFSRQHPTNHNKSCWIDMTLAPECS